MPEGVGWQDYFGVDRMELVRTISYNPIPGVANRIADLPMTQEGPSWARRVGPRGRLAPEEAGRGRL